MDTRHLQCGPGQDIEVLAGIIDPAVTRETAGPIMYMVEIANNSHNDVWVKSIRLEPGGALSNSGLNTVHREFDQLIPEGEDHLFEIPASDVWIRSNDFWRQIDQRRLEFSTTVTLSNGDSYHCRFQTQWR